MTSPGWSGKWFLLMTCGSFSRTRTKTNATVNMANARFSVSGTCCLLCMCFFMFIGFVCADYLGKSLSAISVGQNRSFRLFLQKKTNVNKVDCSAVADLLLVPTI